MRGVPRRPAAPRAAALRALRRAGRVAGRALPRVRRPADRVRDGARGGRLRRRGAPARPRWKERGLRRLAAEAAALVAERLPPPDVDALTFVPADRTRRLERGHNPAERLARELALLWELPCEPLLERVRGGRQRGATATERRSVRGAFRAVAPAPRRVALVDDVYTTGATASAASTALRAAGARRVEVVTFARALRRI